MIQHVSPFALAFFRVLTDPKQDERIAASRRAELAKWIGDSRNGLTNRVIVNRIWQGHFGTGLVSTPSDFGTQGALPSHSELLDWLTQMFVQDKGRFKGIHRMILLSAAWQQASSHPQSTHYQTLDPQDQLLWRAPVRRLRAEQIRDAMLAASGELNLKLGGPSVEETTHRRSLYVKSFRNKNDRFLDGFDMANGLKSVPVRDTTTTPTQALLMINGQYSMARAEAMSKRLLEKSQDPMELVLHAFHAAWNHTPTEAQAQGALSFLDVEQAEGATPVEESKLTDFCHVLLNSNQFLYVR